MSEALSSDDPGARSKPAKPRYVWIGPGIGGGLILTVLGAFLGAWFGGLFDSGPAGSVPPSVAQSSKASAATSSPTGAPSVDAPSATGATGDAGATGTGNSRGSGPGGAGTVVVGPTTLTVVAALDDPSNGDPLNLTPFHNVRPMFVRIYTTGETLVYESQKGATQVPGTDRYMAMFTLASTWKTGPYQVKIRLDHTLWQPVRGVPTITAGAATTLPVTAPVPGDVNEDNRVSVNDYDIILACYSDFEPPKGPCDAGQRRGADINDDNAVNAVDVNLYLRIMSARGGG